MVSALIFLRPCLTPQGEWESEERTLLACLEGPSCSLGPRLEARSGPPEKCHAFIGFGVSRGRDSTKAKIHGRFQFP